MFNSYHNNVTQRDHFMQLDIKAFIFHHLLKFSTSRSHPASTGICLQVSLLLLQILTVPMWSTVDEVHACNHGELLHNWPHTQSYPVYSIHIRLLNELVSLPNDWFMSCLLASLFMHNQIWSIFSLWLCLRPAPSWIDWVAMNATCSPLHPKIFRAYACQLIKINFFNCLKASKMELI